MGGRGIVHRAKERLGPDRPVRFDPGPEEERRLVDGFLTAVFDGDLDSLHEILTEDVIAWSDGGADQRAARRPVMGSERVALLFTGIARRASAMGEIDLRHARINGDPGVVVRFDGEVFLTLAIELAPDGIRAVRSILNPRKLDHLR